MTCLEGGALSVVLSLLPERAVHGLKRVPVSPLQDGNGIRGHRVPLQLLDEGENTTDLRWEAKLFLHSTV